MTRAEERALEAYPYSKGRAVVTGFGTIEFDQNHDERVGFVKGYNQAKQDFIEKALTYLDDKFYFNNIFYGIVSTDFNSVEEMYEDFKNYMKGE